MTYEWHKTGPKLNYPIFQRGPRRHETPQKWKTSLQPPSQKTKRIAA